MIKVSTGVYECGICYSNYDNLERIPVFIECGHTICKACYSTLYESQSKCPSCQFPIKERNPASNYTLIQLMGQTSQKEILNPVIAPILPKMEEIKQIKEKKKEKEREDLRNIRELPTEGDKMEIMGMSPSRKYLIEEEDPIPPNNNSLGINPPDKNPSPYIYCSIHPNEDLEWFLSSKDVTCLICRKIKNGHYGHWKCKHDDYFACVESKPPTYKSCPGHPTIRLKWTHSTALLRNKRQCKMCLQIKSLKDCVACSENCNVCRDCHSTHFQELGIPNEHPIVIPNTKFPWLLACICSWYLFTPCIILCKKECNKCNKDGYQRLKTGDCLTRFSDIKMESAMCPRCIIVNDYCSFHSAEQINTDLLCFKCKSLILKEVGFWICPKGDMVLCSNCFFYPSNQCPNHTRSLMTPAYVRITDDKESSLDHNICSLCRLQGAQWKCPECPFLACEKCTLIPLFCPNHPEIDLVYKISKKTIFCALCSAECSGLGIYSCPKSDFNICDRCYKNHPVCPEEHKMGFVCPTHPNKPLRFSIQSNYISCCHCKRSKNGIYGMFDCSNSHGYQLCPDCYDAQSKVDRDKTKCPEHGGLQLLYKIGTNQISCCICKEEKNANIGYFCCSKGDYIACNTCYTQRIPPELSHCPAHNTQTLNFKVGTRINCFGCKASQNAIYGYYSCNKGDYNICITCYEGIIPHDIIRCPAHITSDLQYKVGVRINCFACKTQQNANFGYYSCIGNDYNICTTCYRQIIPHEIAHCPAHYQDQLLFKIGSTSVECFNCKQRKNAKFGYYSCANEDYIICTTCYEGRVPITGNRCPYHGEQQLKFLVGINIDCCFCKSEKDARFGYYKCPLDEFKVCEECYKG